MPGRPVPRFTYVSGGHLTTAPDVVEDIAEEMNTSAYPAYSQTKFVAEMLVARCAARFAEHGLLPSVSIIKPGLIMGDSRDGVSNTDDYMWRITASALEMGTFNGDENSMWLTAAGVDLVARIVLDRCFDNGATSPVIEKILSGVTMGEYWQIVSEETGKYAHGVGAAEWTSSLRSHVHDVGKTHRLWPVLHFVEDKGGVLGQPLNDLPLAVQRQYQQDVRMALRKSLRYLMAIGYIQSAKV